MRDTNFKQDVSDAWNIGGPGLYQEQLEYLEKQPNDVEKFRVYMTKIYKTFPCDVFYPIQTWNRLKYKFQELKLCDGIPHLGQIINDNDDVQISFDVYELNFT